METSISYLDSNDPSLKALRREVPFDFQHLNTFEKAKMIGNFVHNLFSHDGNNKPLGFDTLSIIKEAKEGKKFRCVEYSFVMYTLLWAYGIPARTIGLKTRDCEIRTSDAGHVVVEFWDDQQQKWIMIDVQCGIILENEDVPLSAYELGQSLNDNITPNILHVGVADSFKQDEDTYFEWVRQYLYYFDTSIKQKPFLITDDERAKEFKFMLVPPHALKPKVFQNILPITAIYTEDSREFYLAPKV